MGLEPIPADIGQEVAYTLNELPVHHWPLINLNLLDCERKPEYSDRRAIFGVNVQ